MDVILTNATMMSTLYTIQVPTIDIDVGIIPDKISYDVTLNEFNSLYLILEALI